MLPHDAPDLASMAAIANKLLDLAYTEWESWPSDRRNLDAAISALQALQPSTTSSAATVLTSRAFALIGPVVKARHMPLCVQSMAAWSAAPPLSRSLARG